MAKYTWIESQNDKLEPKAYRLTRWADNGGTVVWCTPMVRISTNFWPTILVALSSMFEIDCWAGVWTQTVWYWFNRFLCTFLEWNFEYSRNRLTWIHVNNLTGSRVLSNIIKYSKGLRGITWNQYQQIPGRRGPIPGTGVVLSITITDFCSKKPKFNLTLRDYRTGVPHL